ncbi:sensor histidine kinase [Phenylobacterium sp.]|uniref:sensor histidine kinase n=1 Tax=Phenylobacterium sp. TaxID=1871053 RepID=UPI003D2E192F
MTNTPNPLSDARLVAVLDSISDVYYAVDRDWRLVLFNRRAEEFFGQSREDMLGRGFWELFPQGRGTTFGDLLETAMRERSPQRITAPSALRAGRTVDIRINPLSDDDGLGVSIDDITERAEAERAVKRSEQRLDLAVSAIRIGIFDWHVPSGWTMWNGEMEDIFGIPRGTFEGHADHFRRRVHPEDLPRLEAEHAAAIAAGRDLITHNFRIVRPDGAVRWLEGAARFLFGAGGALRRMVGATVDVTDRKVAEAHQRLLINELNHRVKNTLAIVQGIAWQSFRTGGAPPAVREAFEGRLAALAAAHDVLTRQSWEAGSIHHIVAEAVAPHHAADGRLTIEGPHVDLPPKTAVALALAMHELATNAVKYGALSTPQGRVAVCWQMDDAKLRLTWEEHGGPPVGTVVRRGFGARLLEHGLSAELKGPVILEFRPEGLICRMEASLA